MVSKVFEKLVKNRIVYHLEKCGLFSDFQYGFSSFLSTSDLLTVVSDRITSEFLNLNLIYETLWTGAESVLLISMLEKLSWFCLTGSITLLLLMWKWMSLFLKKDHLLRCWGWLSLLTWIGTLTLSLLLKLPPRKLEPWFFLWSFFLLRLLCISVYGHAWNIVVMSGLVLLVGSWNC